MNSEELLKGISSILKKHEGFLNSNPELFYAIQDRLFKAIDYEDWQSEEPEDEEDEEDEYEPSFLDDPEADEEYDEDADYNNDGEIDEDEASNWLKENDPETYEEDSHDLRDTAEQPYEEADEAQDEYFEQPKEAQEETQEETQEEEEEAKPKEDTKRSSRYTNWKPKDKYEDHHDETIQRHLADGYSHREAERLAGAHQAPTNFYDALNHSIKPSEPSAKMLEHMKGLSHSWLSEADKKANSSADAALNPVRHASAKMLSAHDDAHKDFAKEYNGFLDSDEVKGLSGRDRHKAVKEWKSKWHESNPDYRDTAIAAADSGKHLAEANETRAQRRQEGERHIAQAGLASGEESQGQSFSEMAAGGQDLSSRGVGQSIGGEQTDEGGYTTNIKKDPVQHFAQKFPDYTKQLKEKLSPEQSSRLSRVDAVRQKTSPAVIRRPKSNE